MPSPTRGAAARRVNRILELQRVVWISRSATRVRARAVAAATHAEHSGGCLTGGGSARIVRQRTSASGGKRGIASLREEKSAIERRSGSERDNDGKRS